MPGEPLLCHDVERVADRPAEHLHLLLQDGRFVLVIELCGGAVAAGKRDVVTGEAEDGERASEAGDRGVVLPPVHRPAAACQPLQARELCLGHCARGRRCLELHQLGLEQAPAPPHVQQGGLCARLAHCREDALPRRRHGAACVVGGGVNAADDGMHGRAHGQRQVSGHEHHDPAAVRLHEAAAGQGHGAAQLPGKAPGELVHVRAGRGLHGRELPDGVLVQVVDRADEHDFGLAAHDGVHGDGCGLHGRGTGAHGRLDRAG
mmetsp:Transcript_66919/g.206923  ORF Transcript_66919/g.206923 Transcript_66919/m.206923 type:complete len:262 (+) Transcript_66919:1078-1863(+)